MKAITCSQCGALIKRIQEGDRFADCDYCHARIPIAKEKILEVSEDLPKKPKEDISAYDLYVKNKEKYGANLDPEPQYSFVGFVLVIGGSAVFLVFIFLVFIFSSFKTPSEARDGSGSGTRAVPYEPVTISDITPVPKVSFTSYVKYNTNLGAEHVQLPTIEADQLPTFDHDELKATVFKEKRIRVRITINTDGEVTEATALNGHEVLRESSVIAAKKSLFSARKGEGTSTLTYIYLLGDEKE